MSPEAWGEWWQGLTGVAVGPAGLGDYGMTPNPWRPNSVPPPFADIVLTAPGLGPVTQIEAASSTFGAIRVPSITRYQFLQTSAPSVTLVPERDLPLQARLLAVLWWGRPLGGPTFAAPEVRVAYRTGEQWGVRTDLGLTNDPTHIVGMLAFFPVYGFPAALFGAHAVDYNPATMSATFITTSSVPPASEIPTDLGDPGPDLVRQLVVSIANGIVTHVHVYTAW